MSAERKIRRRRGDAQMNPDTGLLPRERALVEVLAKLAQEFGLFSTFTNDALKVVTGEAWAGSAAGLCLKGYAVSTKDPVDDGIGYRLTEKGWALFAGVDEEMAALEEPTI